MDVLTPETASHFVEMLSNTFNHESSHSLNTETVPSLSVVVLL